VLLEGAADVAHRGDGQPAGDDLLDAGAVGAVEEGRAVAGAVKMRRDSRKTKLRRLSQRSKLREPTPPASPNWRSFYLYTHLGRCGELVGKGVETSLVNLA